MTDRGGQHCSKEEDGWNGSRTRKRRDTWTRFKRERPDCCDCDQGMEYIYDLGLGGLGHDGISTIRFSSLSASRRRGVASALLALTVPSLAATCVASFDGWKPKYAWNWQWHFRYCCPYQTPRHSTDKVHYQSIPCLTS